jgi:two-component system, OmpR family, phosphate regulon response regulator PhoB
VAEDDETVVTKVGTAESVRTAAVPGRSVGKLLVVDDDPEVRGMLSRLLEVEGYRVTEAMTGAEAIGSLSNGQPDLVILDVMLTTEDGFDVLAAIRRTSDVPVILVTAKGHETDRVLGLKLGADDYVVKPFSVRELLLRVGAVLRRKETTSTDFVEFGELRIDPAAHRAWVADVEIALTTLEFKLLLTLYERKNRVQTRSVLLNDIWGIEADITTRTVDTHVKRLREKLKSVGRYIETVRGVGYRFTESPTEDSE